MVIEDGYYKYYDPIFSGKDYARETETILGFVKEFGTGTVTDILDVGCGTGTHAFELAKRGYSVFGTDTDSRIIAMAEQKLAKSEHRARIRFFAGDVEDAVRKEFDFATSLFHVVNYIQSPKALARFFRAISERLRENGIFVFDCWNGLAAIIDNPREKKTTVASGNEQIEISMEPEIRLMEQQVVVRDAARVTEGGKEKGTFGFEYPQRLWTPWELTCTLQENGFRVMRIASWSKPDTAATHETWKVVFICQKVSL